MGVRRVKGGILLTTLLLFSFFFAFLQFQLNTIKDTRKMLDEMKQAEKVEIMVDVARRIAKEKKRNCILEFDKGRVRVKIDKEGKRNPELWITVEREGEKKKIFQEYLNLR